MIGPFRRSRITAFLAVSVLSIGTYGKEDSSNQLEEYLKEELVPQYGLAEDKSIEDLLEDDSGKLCSGVWEGSEGIAQARLLNIDDTPQEELLILRYEKSEDRLLAVTEVFYTDENGEIAAYDCTELESRVAESEEESEDYHLSIMLEENGILIETEIREFPGAPYFFVEGISYQFADGEVLEIEMYVS